MAAARAIARGRRDAEQWHRDRLFGGVYYPAALLILIAMVVGRTGAGQMQVPILAVAVPAAAALLAVLAVVVHRQRLRPPHFSAPMAVGHGVMWAAGLVFALSLSDFTPEDRYPSLVELLVGPGLGAWVAVGSLVLAVLGWAIALTAAVTTLQRQRDEECDARAERKRAEDAARLAREG